MNKVYEVSARWDGEAGVWVAESDDVPGLVAEADTPDALVEKLRGLIPELLEINGVLERGTPTVEFHVRYQHEESGVAILASCWRTTRRSSKRSFALTAAHLRGAVAVITKSGTAPLPDGAFP